MIILFFHINYFKMKICSFFFKLIFLISYSNKKITYICSWIYSLSKMFFNGNQKKIHIKKFIVMKRVKFNFKIDYNFLLS